MVEMRESAWFESFVVGHDDGIVVMVRGEADLEAMPKFSEVVDQALAVSSNVVFDMADVTFLDSSGLRVIVSAVLRVGEGGSVSITNATPRVAEIIELSGLDTVVDVV
jgi:anti-sigma B factor antagonist